MRNSFGSLFHHFHLTVILLFLLLASCVALVFRRSDCIQADNVTASLDCVVSNEDLTAANTRWQAGGARRHAARKTHLVLFTS